MTYEFIQGKRFAAQVLQDAMGSPSAEISGSAAIESAMRNLEQGASKRPAQYARGILHIVGEAWKVLRKAT